MAYVPKGTYNDQWIRENDPNAWSQIEKYKQDYAAAQAAGNQAGMDTAHRAAEAIRSRYNYSGGYDGSYKISWGADPTTDIGDDYRLDASDVNRWTAPEYESEYLDNINSLMDQLLNREEFNYNPQTDQLYDVYKQAYQREGQRATEDALGNAAILSGGMPSTAAVTAATQAGDYYAAQMADIIPQLEQAAYEKYLNEIGLDQSNLSALRALDNDAYSRFSDQVNWDYMGNRDYINDLNYVNEWNYGLASDAWNRDKYDDETYYNRQMDKVALMSELGDYSGLRTLGYTDEEIAALTAAWQRENSNSSSSGRSGRSGGSGYDEDVAALQRELVDAGYDLEIDGIYGPATQQAYEDYQNKGGGDDGDLAPADNSLLGPSFSQYQPLLETIYEDVGQTFDGYSDEQRLMAFWATARSSGIPDSDTRYFLDHLEDSL